MRLYIVECREDGAIIPFDTRIVEAEDVMDAARIGYNHMNLFDAVRPLPLRVSKVIEIGRDIVRAAPRQSP